MIAELSLLLVTMTLMTLTGWAARLADRFAPRAARFLLLWALILAGFVTYTAVAFVAIVAMPAQELAVTRSPSDTIRGSIALALAVVEAIYLWLFVSRAPFRRWLTRWLPQPAAPTRDTETRPWPRQVVGFDATRLTHAYALGLAQLLFFQTLGDYLLAGGQAGLVANGLEQADILLSSAATALLLLVVALVGVGAFRERPWRAVAERLGLVRPTAGEVVVGIGMAGALLAFQACAGLAWMGLATPEAFDQQTQLSQAIAGGVTTLYGAFLVALFSSIGEEIAFRGALQPVAGLWATSLLFALTHIQYNFTPAAAIIFVVGLALGWVRQHYGTSAAITTHFFYNFTLLVLAWLASQIALPPV